MRRVVIACLFVGACARVPSTHAPDRVVFRGEETTGSPASCARRTQAALPARASLERQGGAIVLARAGDRLIAYVADADSRSVHTLSIDEGKELARTRVGGEPRQLLVLADGRVAATLSDGTRIEILEPAANAAAPLVELCTREVPAEPWGLALSADDSKLVVTSAWGGALTVFDARTLDTAHVVPLARDPRDVIVEGDTAFVSHVLGAKLSLVDVARTDPTVVDVMDLSARKATPLAQEADKVAPRSASQGYSIVRVSLPGRAAKAGPPRILVPMVSVDPGAPERQSSVYYGPPFDGVGKETPFVAVVDPASRQPLNRYVLGTSEVLLRRECLLPRAAALRAKTASLLVACFGIDQLVELDALAVDPARAVRRRIGVPPGPAGVAVDEATGRAVVFSQMGAEVSVLRLDEAQPARTAIALDYHPDPALADAARGRQLFYSTDDERISGDGLGCSSCHVDGRDDGLTWTTPMGPRQTPMLAGRLAGTAPYGWEGDQLTIGDYIRNTVSRLGGKGLDPLATDDLVAFLLTMKAPPSAPPTPVEVDLVAHGHDLFESDEQGCAGCHSGGASTDHVKHNLGTVAPGAEVDTPSLRFLRGTAPYFHDGRYGTLDALLSDSRSHMGKSSNLSVVDRAALAAYLRTL
jgi:DNA-binding beta-propeller fold protein YncE/mono/diheme cytochrome c family protein